MGNIPDVKTTKIKILKTESRFCSRCSFTQRPAHLIYDVVRQVQNIQAKKVIPFSIVVKTKVIHHSVQGQ